MSHDLYLVIHLVGVFLLLMSLGGIALHAANGGSREFANRRWVGLMHGLGLTLMVVAGFGLLARLNLMSSIPAWAWVKIAIWLALGGVPVLFYRKNKLAKPLFFGVLILAGTAACLAIFKPF